LAKVDLFAINLLNTAAAALVDKVDKLVPVVAGIQEFSLELHLCLFLVQAAGLRLVQLQTEHPAAVAEQIKMVAKQVLQQ
jgi:hypothetical protein